MPSATTFATPSLRTFVRATNAAQEAVTVALEAFGSLAEDDVQALPEPALLRLFDAQRALKDAARAARSALPLHERLETPHHA